MRRATLSLVFCTALVAASSRADEAADARSLFDKAMTAVKAKDFAGAIPLLERAVRLQPRNDSYLGNLGYVELMLDRNRAAMEHTEKAIALNGKTPVYYSNAATAAYRLGEHEKAIKYSEKALTFGREQLGPETYPWMITVRNRSRVGPIQDKARAAEKAKNDKQAVSLMKKAVEIAPGDAYLLAYLASIEYRTGEHVNGLAHAEKAIALDGSQAWYYGVAVTHARELAEFTKARQFARKALTFKPPHLSDVTARVAKDLQERLQTRTYTIRWKLDPSKGFGEKGRGKGPFYLPLPSTDLPYQSATFTVRGPLARKVVEQDGVRLLQFDADDNKPIHLTVTATVRFHDYRPRIKEKPGSPYPDEVRAYLSAGPRIDPAARTIQALAAKLKGDTPPATVKNVLAWLKKNLTYRLPSDFDRAEQVIERGYGECGGYSAVLVAVCRASGIPAREVWGPTKPTTDRTPPGCLSGHIWAEVFVSGVGWVPVEPQQVHGFGHMPLGYVRMLHNPPSSLKWPQAMTNAWSAMYNMDANTPPYEEKLAAE